MTNETISHFRILEKIDEGGMGKIFLSEDTDLHRKVVLKALPSQFTSSELLIDRFKREAQAAAALKHPNIVTVHEFFKHEHRFYIAMEYIDGICLSDLMEQREISIKKTLVIAIQICRGLRKAHSVGIIHRDIKPANIMIDKDGWVKILDFGLAKLTENTKITRHGVRMGTAPYISPEQLRGDELKPVSDIFSLGVVLYQLITRQHPFDGDTEEEIMYSILQKEPQPLARYRAGVTPGLQKIIDKALDKDPKMRYRQIDDLLSDLKRENRVYSKSAKPQVKAYKRKSTAEPVTVNVKDIDSNVFRASIARFKTSLLLLKRVKFGNMNIKAKQSTAPLIALLLFVILAGTTLSLYGSRNKSNNRPQLQTNPIQQLIQVKETRALVHELNKFRQQNLISMGKNVDFSLLGNCYLFVLDRLKVLDVFVIKDNLFYSLNSQKKFATPPSKFSGKTKIWIQDLTAKKPNAR